MTCRVKLGRADLSVILPVLNETNSLRQTADILFEECGMDILELFLVVGEPTTNACLTVCDEVRNKYPEKVRIIMQSLPCLGGAIRKGFESAEGTHIAVLYSDLESDPHGLKAMVLVAEQNPSCIISASRWLSQG